MRQPIFMSWSFFFFFLQNFFDNELRQPMRLAVERARYTVGGWRGWWLE